MSKKPQPPANLPSAADNSENDEIASEIAKRIENLIPKNQQTQVTAQLVSLFRQERFSGPIAHPKHLREYEEIHPGAADRIIRMAESNLAHSQRIQERALDSDISEGRLGLWLGFASLILLIGGAITATFLGHEVIAGLFLTAAALGVIGKFINGRNGKE